MQTVTEVYNGDDLKFTQDEKNVIVWAIRMKTGEAMSDRLYRKERRLSIPKDEQERADILKSLWDRMSEAGWEYPSDYCSENYQ